MASDLDEPEVLSSGEVVERRGELRGLMRELTACVDGVDYAVPEASRKGVFIAVAEPDAFPLGEILTVSLRCGDQRIECRGEVARKEIHPRRGIVLRILFVSPADEERLLAMVK